MRILFFVFLLLIGAVSTAQDYAENWATIRLICQDETSYRIEVEAIGATDTVIIGLDIQDAILWEVGSEKTARFNISLENSGVSLTVYAWGGVFFADSLILAETIACNNPPEYIALLREAVLAIERDH